jgi:hypothetical protein
MRCALRGHGNGREKHYLSERRAFVVREPQVAEIADWLMGHVNSAVVIRKEEQGDVDQVLLQLQQVSYIPGADPDHDGYAAEDRLVLQGDGRIATEANGGAADLPRNSYEIPLQTGFRGNVVNNELILNTERAFYRITPQ